MAPPVAASEFIAGEVVDMVFDYRMSMASACQC